MSITVDTTELKRMFEAQPKKMFKAASDANIAARPDPAVAHRRAVENIRNKAIGKQRELMALLDELYEMDEMEGGKLAQELDDEARMRSDYP